MLHETYTCDVCGTPEITPEREVEMRIKAFGGIEVVRDALHVCGDCATRWSKAGGFFDWIRGRIKISEVVGR